MRSSSNLLPLFLSILYNSSPFSPCFSDKICATYMYLLRVFINLTIWKREYGVRCIENEVPSKVSPGRVFHHTLDISIQSFIYYPISVYFTIVGFHKNNLLDNSERLKENYPEIQVFLLYFGQFLKTTSYLSKSSKIVYITRLILRVFG